MQGLAPYLIGGILAVLAVDAFAPPVRASAWFESPGAVQVQPVSINRSAKSDRIPSQDSAPAQTVDQRDVKRKKSPVPDGCDPAFSPLSQSSRTANFSSRCVA